MTSLLLLLFCRCRYETYRENNAIVFIMLTGGLSEMRVVRDPGRAVEAELPADHLSITGVPLVVANGTPFAQV